MRLLRLLLAAMALSLFGFGIPMASAQYSESWEFLKAVRDNDYKEIRERERRGANVNSKNGDGLPAMIIAANQRDVKLMAYILEFGVNIDGRAEGRRETALMQRSESGDFESVTFLVNNGAELNLKDKGGETALMKATRARKRRIVKLLIDSGADVHAADYTGRTAFHYAEEARSQSILRMLRAAESVD